jgi:transcriptional regulator with XRE-family HTH domain
MQRHENKRAERTEIAKWLRIARRDQGLTQAALAERCRLQRQQLTYFERGTRIPSLEQLLRIAQALDLPLQWFLSGGDRPGGGVRALAIELRNLGLIDLWVDKPLVPGAFRRPEEVVALAVAGEEPEARIVEGIPTILAWNRWKGILLRAFARATGARTVYRLAWLAEIVLALERRGGFPDGCPGKKDLEAFVKRVKPPPAHPWDGLGRPVDAAPTSPLWKRWRISYPADVATFRQRAEGLVALRQAEGNGKSIREE